MASGHDIGVPFASGCPSTSPPGSGCLSTVRLPSLWLCLPPQAPGVLPEAQQEQQQAPAVGGCSAAGQQQEGQVLALASGGSSRHRSGTSSQ